MFENSGDLSNALDGMLGTSGSLANPLDGVLEWDVVRAIFLNTPPSTQQQNLYLCSAQTK